MFEGRDDESIDIFTLNIPDTIKGIPVKEISLFAISNCNTLKEVNISSQNEYFSSVDGIVYSKDKSCLLTVPPAKNCENFSFPSNTQTIGENAFYNNISLTNIVIPQHIHMIDYDAFCSPNLKSITILDPKCDINDSYEELEPSTISNGYNANIDRYYYGGVIRGYDNSTAQQYAQHYGIKFESLGPDPASTTTTTTTTTKTTTTTTTTTTNTSSATTTTTTPPANTAELKFGDVNGDNIIDGRDATDILTEYAEVSAGKEPKFSAAQQSSGDANKDGIIDGRDATAILTYYAYISTGKNTSLEEFIRNQETKI